MKNKNEPHLDLLAAKLMNNAPAEIAPPDFTSRVMNKVYSVNDKKSFSYQPAISKPGWIGIFAMMGGIVVWLLLKGDKAPTASGIGESWIYLNKLAAPFTKLRLSDDVARILLLAAAVMGVQIILLYQYLNKKFSR